MNYIKNITVPPNTFENSPLKETIIIRERYLTRIDISIDTVATKGLVGVQVHAGKPGFSIFHYPFSAGEWVRKSDVWVGKFDLGDYYTQLDILATSCLNGISATKNHLVIFSITTSNT